MDMETGVKPQASVSTLSMTLGLFALGIAWRNAAKMFSIPPAIGETILLLTGCLWLFLLFVELVRDLLQRLVAFLDGIGRLHLSQAGTCIAL